MPAKLFILLTLALAGCVHHIGVNPLPSGSASTSIPRSLQIVVGPLMMEGADHMPGIALLEWPHRDLRRALIQYVQRRGTFASVSTESADLTLRVATKLTLRSHDRYHYRIRLQAEMNGTAGPIKTYAVEHDAAGSRVRWVTASDRAPIEAALGLALDDLLTRIEADRSLYVEGKERPAK